MFVPKQKPFSFKQIEIITMVLTKLYFLRDALDHFGQETGVKRGENETVKYELWKQGISLDNYNQDKILVHYFIDRINHHVHLQKNIKKTFKTDLKNNPFMKIEIHDWSDQRDIFTKWVTEKFATSAHLSESEIDRIVEIDCGLIIDEETIEPHQLMAEGNRIWQEYKFNEVYTLPKMKRLSDYKYTELKTIKKKDDHE